MAANIITAFVNHIGGIDTFKFFLSHHLLPEEVEQAIKEYREGENKIKLHSLVDEVLVNYNI